MRSWTKDEVFIKLLNGIFRFPVSIIPLEGTTFQFDYRNFQNWHFFLKSIIYKLVGWGKLLYVRNHVQIDFWDWKNNGVKKIPPQKKNYQFFPNFKKSFLSGFRYQNSPLKSPKTPQSSQMCILFDILRFLVENKIKQKIKMVGLDPSEPVWLWHQFLCGLVILWKTQSTLC